MASVQWTSPTSGSWTVPSNWNTDSLPGTGDDVFISASGSYTVSLTASITVASLTIGDASAVLQIQDPGGDDAITGDLGDSGSLGVDAVGPGGSTLTVGGTLTDGNYLQVGNSGMTAADLLTVDGAFINTGAQFTLEGGRTGATAQAAVTGAAPGTLTGTYSVVANAGGASLQWGSGGVAQIGDGASNGGDLYIDGADALVEVGATNSNSALDALGTIAGNGLLDLRDGVTLATAGGLTVDGGDGRLKIDAYGGSGGGDVTIGGDLTNGSAGNFGDGGVSVGGNGITVADTLTVDGTVSNTGIVDVIGGQTGATARMLVTGAAPGTLTGTYNVVANAGGAILQFGSGGITQIGDGASLGGDLYIDGSDAFAEIGSTNSNNALTGLATIAGNGLLDLRDGVTVTTDGGLTVNGGDGRLKVDAYGGSGGSDVTIGGNLVNSSAGNFGDGGVSVGGNGITVSDTLTVDGTVSNTGIVDVIGGQTGAAARMLVTGAAPGILTGTYNVVGDAGGAVLQFGSGGITQIGDGASLGGDLYIDGTDAFAEIGATDSNNALTGLTTIAGNGLLDLRDGVTLTTSGSLTIDGGDGRLKVDAYGSSGGGSDVTVGGDLTNSSFGNFGDGGVSVGNGNMSAGATLAVDGAFNNTGGLLTLTGGRTGAAAQMTVAGAAPATLTGQYNIVGDASGASLQWGSGGITQIGDGAGNSGYLYIDGSNAFAEIGTTDSNSALDTLSTIAGNGVLDLRDGVTVTTTGGLTVDGGDGRLKVDAYGGAGGSDVTIGGNLTNGSFGNFGDGGVSVGNGNMSTGATLAVDGVFNDTGGLLTLTGGRTDAAAQITVTGAAPGTLTGQYNIVGDAGGASLQWGSGGITQIGDGASNSGYLYIDGSNAFAEIGATGSNSALTGLTTIAGNGVLDLRDGVKVTTSGNLIVDGGDGRLKVDAYGGSGGSDITVGGDLTNGSGGSFGDGGVAVGTPGMTHSDLLTVDGTFTNTGGIANIDGGQTGAAAQMIVNGAAAGTLTGQYNIVADAGGASLQWGSGGITQIGDGASNGGGLYLDGADAFAEIGATNSNSALTGLATIAGNGLLDLRDGVTVTTSGSLTINGGDGRLKVDAYGGSGGSDVTVGGDLVNESGGSFGDGGVAVGTPGMTHSDLLTVDGTFTNTGGIANIDGGQTGAAAQMIVTGAAAGTLTGQYGIVANAGGASLQWGGGGITQIGDGATNGADLYVDGATAYAEIGATNSNSALDTLATIAGNGLLDLRDGVTVTTAGSLTIDGGDGRLKVDAYGGTGGSDFTVDGDLVNDSPGSFGDGGVEVGNSGMTHSDLLTVDGAFTNTGEVVAINGGQAGAAGQMVVTGAAPGTLTGSYDLVSNAGGASLQWGSGGITQIGDGASIGSDLYIDGATAYAEIGATNSNSALDTLATIAGNGLLDLRDGVTLTTAGSLTVDGGDGRLKVDAYGGGSGGGDVTIGGDLVNDSPGSFGDGGVGVGTTGMTHSDLLTVDGTLVNNAGAVVALQGNANDGGAGQAVIDTTAVTNDGAVNIFANAVLEVAAGNTYTQNGGSTFISGTLVADSIALNGGVIDLSTGDLESAALTIAAGSTLFGFGTVAPAITSAGSIEASGGSLDLAGGLAAPAALAIENASALELAGADSGGVTFAGGSGIFVLDDPTGFTGTITGLGIGDTLVLDNTQATGATASFDSGTDTSTLAVTIAGGGTLDFTLAGDYAGDAFGTNRVGNDTQIAAVGAAVGQINTPVPVALGRVRQGAGASIPLSITNNAPSGSAALDVTIGGVTGGATASGTIVALAPGATDATDITVGIGNGLAGVQSGTVTLDFASLLSGGNAAPLPSESLPVSGTVYREAIAAIAPLTVYAHVGDPGVETLEVSNVATPDGFSEALIAALTGATGSFTVADAGPTGDILAGASDTTTLGLSFSTAQPGVVSGDAVVSLTSDGGTGVSSIDGLGTIGLGTETVPISVDIDNFATAAIQAPADYGTLSVNGDAATLDLGTVAENTGLWDLNFGLANTATGPADLLSGSFVATAANGFTLGGLSGFSDLGAGQTIAEGVTLDTSVGGVVTQTITLDPTDSNASGYSAPLAAQTITVTGTVEVLPPPTITMAPTLTAMTDVPALLGLSIADPNPDTLPVIVTISDATGTLYVQSIGSAVVSGNGSNALTLTGDVTDLNEALATLEYTGGAVGNDTINVGVVDQHHASATQSTTVDIIPVPPTAPALNAPFATVLIPGQPSGVGGISIDDPVAEASGQQISLTLTSTGFATGDINVTGQGGTVIGNGTTVVTIEGTVNEVNSYLSDGVTEDILADAYAKAQATAKEVGETYGKAWALFFGISMGAIADGLAGAGEEFVKSQLDETAELTGNPTPPNLGGMLLQVDAGLYSFAANVLNDVAALAAGATELPPPAGEGGGDTHIVTYDGQIYQLDGAGDYLLTGSTAPSDSFTVEVRLTPLNGSPSASVISQVAAQVGTDTVTIGDGPSAVVTIDGNPVSLTTGTPDTLSGGQITELSTNTYQITWTTGEILTVTDYNSFLNVKVGLGSNDTPGSLTGLMGPDNGQANDFTLPDGTVASVVTTSDLYNFADSYLLPPNDSLLTGADTPNVNFPTTPLSLADFPAAEITAAAQAVASAGITDPGALAAAELDYLLSGGNLSFVAADQSLFQGVTTTEAAITPPPLVPMLGVLPDQPTVNVNQTGTTAVTFDVELTQATTVATTVAYAVVAPNSTDLSATAFGGTLPSGSVTIGADETSGEFTIDVPEGALAALASADVAVQISSPDGVPIYASQASATITTPQPGTPPVPTLTYTTDLGTFLNDGNNNYTLDLGPVQYGQPLPTLQFGIENAATAPADELTGTLSVAPVEGFTVSGATLPGPLAAGQSYDGLTATINTIKFGDNSETITFDPVDTNSTGYSAALSPITLTITDTLELPDVTYSQAWGDVHIVTYNGLTYNFQAVGDYTLAASRIPGDTFDIEMDLEPWYTGASVTTIHQVAITLGTDTATFEWNRTGAGSDDPVWIDHSPVAFTIGQTMTLAGGTISEVSPDVFKVDWNTGETMTVTNGGSYINIVDGVPPGDLSGGVAGLQGEGEGAANDFQLADGEVLPQPLTTNQLYGEFLQSWQAPSTDFDGTAPPYSGPVDALSLTDLPADVVAQAADLVAAAGITNPAIAQEAELDYLATGDPSFITSAVATQQQASTVATSVNVVTASTPPVPAIGVMANATKITEASSGATVVTFSAYLTSDQSTATDVHYTVIAGGTGFFDASSFGGTLPSGDVTIASGTESANFQISLPAGALGSLPSENLQVEVSSGAGNATALPIFSPTAQTEVDNDQPVPGTLAVPELSELSGGGTLTFDSTTDTYTLNLGTLLQGSAQPTIKLALDNAAAPPADSLDGSFTAPLGTGFAVTGAALSAPIAAGADYTGLALTVNTGVLGSNTMSLGFNPTDVNETGYSASLGGQITLKVVDTIATPAVAAIDAPSTMVFPNVHVGTTESRQVAVTNTASAPAAGLDVTPYATGFVTATGTVALLAPGVTNSSNLSVALDTSTDGSLSGVVDLVTQSDTGSGTPAAITPFPAIGVFGNVFNLASGTIAPVTDFVHVGDPGTVAVGITNTATADGFSENLLATLGSVTQGVGTIGIAAAGPTGEIVAGSSDTSSLLLDFSTAQAGTISGTVTVDLTSDGGTGTGSIDGLGTTALPSQMAPVTIMVDNFANPVFENVSGIGTFAQSGTAYTLDLGTIDQGSGPFALDLGVINDVTGPADVASGSLQASGSSAFTASGLSAFSGLAGGQADIAPMVTLSTDDVGTFSETITLAGTDSNAGGYSAMLPAETLVVTGTVAATTGGIGETPPAIASVVPSGTIDFGAVHLGTPTQQNLAISNTATTGAAALDGSVSSTTGDATANGSFTGLAPGAPASSAISVGINTGTAGVVTGTASLAFVSDAGTLGIADLPNQDITVSGSVYREAVAALTPINEIVHVGNPGTAFLAVANSDPNDDFSESLVATLLSTTGNIGIASGGPTGDIAAGATNTSALSVSFSTALAGTISGIGTIGLTSDGGTGIDSIDGLGQTPLSDQTVAVNVTVDNYAVAELTSNGNLTSNGLGSNAFTLNLGSTTQGATALSADLGVLNDVTGPADWLSGTLGVSGSSQFDNSGFGTFGTIDAGGSVAAGGVTLATNQLGTFSETIVLTPVDTDADDFSEVMTAKTVTVTGTIVPTGVAQGDVHMVTFDGLHYDFQADGSYVLTRSTVPGDDFQIQIRTAPDAANHAVSYTTEAAAQVGSDVVTFAINRASTIWIDGTPDTALSAADPVQTFAGGQLQELSAGNFLLTWTTGQTLSITDQGSHLDSSVGLGAANGPGSVQGLLGSDSGQANDFQLPDGTVLARPLSGAELYGAFADAWSVTPANSLLDAPATTGGHNPTVVPVAVGTTSAGTMQFIYPGGAGGQTVLAADASGQVLSAAAGADVLSDAGGLGVTFQGTLAQFADELISGFSAKDMIDITDLDSATAAVSYAGSGSAGVLYLTDGVSSGELYLAGQLAGGSFRVSSDTHGGTQIAFS